MSASGGKVSLFNMMTFKVNNFFAFLSLHVRESVSKCASSVLFLFWSSCLLLNFLLLFLSYIYSSAFHMQTMTTFMPPPPAATFLAFHPQDNNIIAIGMEDSSIQIYNVRVDEVFFNAYILWFFFIGKQAEVDVIQIAYAPFWQVKTKLKGHQKRITGLAFSHVLNVLVSSGADSQVRGGKSLCMHG